MVCRNRIALSLLALALGLAGPSAVIAQALPTLPDSVHVLEEITVTTSRRAVTIGSASAITTALDSAGAAPAPTLEDVLRETPLVQVRENSRGEVQPQLRGMESRQVAVLVDGIPLTLGWDNRTDLAVLPVTAARELTLVRGLSSVLHGPNALGGVVLVSMGEKPERPIRPLRVDAGTDHLGSAALALGIERRIRAAGGDWLLRAGGGVRDRPKLPLAAGIAQPPPGNARDRLNSDARLANAYVVGRYRAKGGAWGSVSSFGFASERGVPPELDVAEPRLWRYPETSRWVTSLSGGSGWRATPWGEGDLEASVGLDYGTTAIDTYSSLAYDTVDGGERGDDRILSLRVLGDHTAGSGMLRGAFTLAEARHDERLESDELGRYRQRLWSLGLEHELPLLYGGAVSPRARLSVGASADGADTPETGGRAQRDRLWDWGGRAGATLALGAGAVQLHGGWSRRVRFPALRELYSGALGRFTVNESLGPEALEVAEMGMTWRVRGFETQVVAFHQRLRDAIVRVSLGDGTLQRQNREEIRSLGLECLGSASWRKIAFAASGTLKDVSQRDPSAPTARAHPEYQPAFAGDFEMASPLALGLRARARVEHVGARYCVHPDLGTDVRLAADSWLDLSVTRRFTPATGPSVELALALDNVTDEASFDQCGLPQPGRLARVQMRAEW